MRILHLNFLFSLVLFISLCGCNKKKEIKIPEVTVFKVRNEEYRQVWTLVGETISDPKVDLLARVKGFLVKRDFKQGAFVKKGELPFSCSAYDGNIFCAGGISSCSSIRSRS